MPTAAEAAVWGLTVEEASGDPVGVWPDNLASLNVFIAMGTQWRVGMGGPTGLDYTPMTFVMRAAGVHASERSAVFDDVRTLEETALETMRKNKK